MGLTLALAAYYGWLVISALLMLVSAGMSPQNVLAAYIPGGLVILFFILCAFAVFRGYRWSLFLYQIGVVLAGIQLLLLAPSTWEFVVLLAQKPAARAAITTEGYLTFVMPVLLFAAALYSAIVVYRQIYAFKGIEAPKT
jgi:hypothetical protein